MPEAIMTIGDKKVKISGKSREDILSRAQTYKNQLAGEGTLDKSFGKAEEIKHTRPEHSHSTKLAQVFPLTEGPGDRRFFGPVVMDQIHIGQSHAKPRCKRLYCLKILEAYHHKYRLSISLYTYSLAMMTDPVRQFTEL